MKKYIVGFLIGILVYMVGFGTIVKCIASIFLIVFGLLYALS